MGGIRALKAPNAPSMPGVELPEEKQSVYQSWLHELIAIDSVRKTASTLFLEMRNEPEKCVNFIDALNEMYRIIRPICFDDEIKKFDKYFDEALSECENYTTGYKARRGENINHYEQIPKQLRGKLNDLFHSVYMLRHIHRLGFKVKEKQLTGKEALQRSLAI